MYSHMCYQGRGIGHQLVTLRALQRFWLQLCSVLSVNMSSQVSLEMESQRTQLALVGSQVLVFTFDMPCQV